MKGFKALTIALCLMLVATASVTAAIASDETPQSDTVLAAGFWDDFVTIGIGYDGSNPSVLAVFISPLLAAGWILRGYADENTGASGDIAKDHEAELVYTILNSNKELLENSINGYGDIWKFTNSYWMRQAEIASAELWQTGSAYDATTIAIRSGLYQNLVKLFDNVHDGPDKTFELIDDRLSTWASASGYSGMSVVVEYGTSSTSRTITDASSMDITIRSVIDPTSGADRAYLAADGLYVWGSGAVITAKNGTPYSLVEGYNDLSRINGFESGVYQFSTNATYAGTILPALDSRSADVCGGAVITSGSTYTLATYLDGRISLNSALYTNLGVKIGTGSGYSETVDLVPLIGYYDALITSAEESLTKSHTAALTAWTLFTNANEANILISPSSLVPANVEISSEELYAITVMYLQQIYDYYQRVGAALESTGFSMSTESLNLYMRGDVYDETGTLLYQDVVMTPYIWLRNMSLALDKITINQPGTLAIWGESTNLRSWTGVEKGEPCQSVLMQAGYTLDIKEMMRNGQNVSTLTLTVMEIHEWDTIVNSSAWDPIKINDKASTIATLVMIVCLEAAAIFALLWHETDEILLLIVAAIMAVIGLFANGWIAGLL